MIVVLSGDDGSVMMMTRVVAVDVVNTFLLLVCWNLQVQTFNVGGARRSHYLRVCVCVSVCLFGHKATCVLNLSFLLF